MPISGTVTPLDDRPTLITPTHQADSCILNQGHSYAQNIPTHRAPYHSFTTYQRVPSYPRAAPTPRVSFDSTLTRLTTRERGWSTAGVTNSNTYAAALRSALEEKHHTSHYHSPTHTPGAREWNRNNLLHHQTSTTEVEGQETYVSD